VRSGKLKLDGPWAQLRDPGELEAWLDELEACDWNVFVEGSRGVTLSTDPRHLIQSRSELGRVQPESAWRPHGIRMEAAGSSRAPPAKFNAQSNRQHLRVSADHQRLGR
jgi:hypothetical protein